MCKGPATRPFLAAPDWTIRSEGVIWSPAVLRDLHRDLPSPWRGVEDTTIQTAPSAQPPPLHTAPRRVPGLALVDPRLTAPPATGWLRDLVCCSGGSLVAS